MAHGAAQSSRLEASALQTLSAAFTRSERFAPDEMRRRQSVLLDALFEHHTTTTQSFRDRLEHADLYASSARGFARLRKLPPISRHQIQSARDTFNSSRIPSAHFPLDRVKTSGSTGEPVSIIRTAVNRLYWSAFGMRDHAWNGRDVGGRMCAIRAGIETRMELSDWGQPANLLGPTGRCLALPITTPVGEQVTVLDEFQPEILLVYPNNLRALVDEWHARKALLGSLKHIRTIGETVSDDLRRHVQANTGLRIEDSYSSQEAGPIAIQCPEGGLYHIMSEALVVEVLDDQNEMCAPGQTGRIVLTDLHNYAAPLIRYDIGDFASVAGACTCGRTLPTLGRILGRERNLLRRRNGDRHWPLVGFHSFDNVAPVRQYQFIQHTFEEIELRLVTDDALDDAQQQRFRSIAASALGGEFHFRVTQSRTRLPVGANGKFEEFVCRVA